MMYSNKMVAVIKVNGKILRERGDEVFLPFKSEYSILLKNLDTRKAVVTISIDGQDVLDGYHLVIDGNSQKEVTRFIKDGNLNCGPRFKFIEKTEKISEYRGDRCDDGIVRIEYQFEQSNPKYTSIIHEHHYYNYPSYNTWTSTTYGGLSGLSETKIGSGLTDNIVCPSVSAFACNASYSNNVGAATLNSVTLDNCSFDSTAVSKEISRSLNTDGITANGSESHQSFELTSTGILDPEKYVICLKLRGASNEIVVKNAITVKHKIICKQCGTKNSSRNKFCTECGNNLNW